MKELSREELPPIIIGKLLNIGGILQKKGNQLLLPYKLNQQQFSILFSISEEGRVNQKNMVNKLLLEKSHVSKVVKKLSSMGLIKIENSNEDKRNTWLSITSEGKNTIDQCREVLGRWNSSWSESLDRDQMYQLLESLTLVQDIFKKLI